MDLIIVSVVAALLVLVSIAMILSHVRTWRRCQRDGADAVELDYRRRQFRRRMQTSAMLGILALSLPAGIAVAEGSRSGWFPFFYCLAVVLFVCWVVLLALADVWATKRHYGRLREECFVEKIRLEAEIRRRTKDG